PVNAGNAQEQESQVQKSLSESLIQNLGPAVAPGSLTVHAGDLQRKAAGNGCGPLGIHLLAQLNRRLTAQGTFEGDLGAAVDESMRAWDAMDEASQRATLVATGALLLDSLSTAHLYV